MVFAWSHVVAVTTTTSPVASVGIVHVRVRLSEVTELSVRTVSAIDYRLSVGALWDHGVMVERSEEWTAGYDVGYREGESSRDADYWFVLDEMLGGVLPAWDDESADMSPQMVAALIAPLLPEGLRFRSSSALT